MTTVHVKEVEVNIWLLPMEAWQGVGTGALHQFQAVRPKEPLEGLHTRLGVVMFTQVKGDHFGRWIRQHHETHRMARIEANLQYLSSFTSLLSEVKEVPLLGFHLWHWGEGIPSVHDASLTWLPRSLDTSLKLLKNAALQGLVKVRTWVLHGMRLSGIF